MLIISKEIKLLSQAWERMLLTEKGALLSHLSDSDMSALSAWVQDCFQSFQEIYTQHLEKIKNAAPDDFELMHDCTVDLFWQLDHIRTHIADAEKGFSVLMNLLAKKASKEDL